MMVQAVGMVLVIGSTTLFGGYFASKKRFRRDDLETMVRALTLLKNQICFLSMPLPEAMADIAEKFPGSIGGIFQWAGQMMASRMGSRADEIWKDALNQAKGGLYFTAEDMDMLLSFGKTLGYLDVSQQQDGILLLIDYLKGQQASLQMEWGKQQRLYYSMGVLSGLLLIVALL